LIYNQQDAYSGVHSGYRALIKLSAKLL
jgi:hypothetical protein